MPCDAASGDAASGPWLLDPARRRYAWGSPHLLPDLLAEPGDGQPLAELWFGAHPAGSAVVPGCGGVPLASLLQSDPPATLGSAAATRGGDLPFMVKLIAAARPLSIQTHPGAAHAAAGFAEENDRGLAPDDPTRRYQDGRAKPEIVCALGDFDALIDFRPINDVVAHLRAAGLDDLADLVESGGFEAGVRTVLSADRASTDHAIDRLISVGDELAATLAVTYPGDPGVVVATFLNRVRMRAGQAAFLAPGSVHAYLSGLALEVMATSDNVLRAGLTSKLVDVDEFLVVARLTSGAPDLLHADADGAYPQRTPEFALARHRPGEQRLVDGPAIVVCTSGSLQLGELTLPRGHGAFVCAAPGPVDLGGAGEGFVAAMGLRGDAGRPGSVPR